MSFASLRFSDAQRLKSLEVGADSAQGTLLTYKTRKKKGLDWPWAFPLMGMTGTTDWAQPMMYFRTAHERVNGVSPSFAFPILDRVTPYSTDRRKLSLLCLSLGDSHGESYTLHSARNLSPKSANQTNFVQR